MVNLQKNHSDSESTRDLLIDSILQKWGFQNYSRIKLQADASFRKYEILNLEEKNFILMDAPPEYEDVKPFIQKDRILCNMGLKAPEIYFEDIKNGILLLENFGDRKFKAEVERSKTSEVDLYKNALDVLVHISKHQCPTEIDEYDNKVLLREANLFTEWYLKYNSNFTEDELEGTSKEYEEIILELVSKLKFKNEVFVMRDYHADNLMILDDNRELQSLGLLDFQDGLKGNITYDVVSLLEDARRDVSKNLREEMIDYFCEKAGLDREGFLNDYYILGAQRNLKILGIFTRLCYRDNKKHYLDFIPRVMEYLKGDIEHSTCRRLKEFLDNLY